MVDEWWNTIVRVLDYFLITMQSEVFFVFYIVTGLVVLYYLCKPLIRFLVALEWHTFLTYIVVVLCMFHLIYMYMDEPNWRYIIYGISIFSLIISVNRLFTVLKDKQAHSN
ncbi:hypothetical protein SH601_02590 [Gracilibacillus sp. S3-1-1]|uniref:Uncharacterized protein n=1 Tax=Gracilibacillus pellucidus TaxID=3095368 RepID=A0ACC6M1N8_9BACI|nr:hypothetical protein [Gracilibacillus sp. S3-1-1]MDX8044863.1 hypothetical protein [Gracilibacillus sp. S3-1-1]